MKTNAKFSTVLKKNKPVKKGINKGEVPIYLRITYDNARREEMVIKGVTCKEEEWDAARGRIIGRNANVARKNSQIEQAIASAIRKIEEIERSLPEESLNTAALINILKGKGEKKPTVSLCDFFEEHNAIFKQLVGRERSEATYDRYETLLRILKKFIKTKYHVDDIPFYSINYSFVEDFQNYLLTVRKCCNNTTVKYLKNLKKILRLALRRGLLTIDPFVGIRFSLTKVHPEFLTEEELQRIMNKEISNECLSRVRDCFVFACFTGLTYGDLKDLSRDKLVEEKRRLCIVGYRGKTDEPYYIPLVTPALQILKKYENDPACIVKGKLLPVKSNQRMNEYLKAIAAICDINKNLHIHVARHSAATNLLNHGVPLEVVSQILGHSSIKMTEHYAKLIKGTIIKAINNIDDQITKTYTNAVPAEI